MNTCEDPWHYQTPHPIILETFGHLHPKIREFTDYLEKKLPQVTSPPEVVVDWTGYWYAKTPPTVPELCQTTDAVNRKMFFLGDDVLVQRYADADTYIHYNKNNWRPGTHSIFSESEIPRYLEIVQKSLA